jgi:hypothetical protein
MVIQALERRLFVEEPDHAPRQVAALPFQLVQRRGEARQEFEHPTMLSDEKFRRASRDLSRTLVNRHQQIFFDPHVCAQFALVKPQPLRRQFEVEPQERLLMEEKKLVQALMDFQELGKYATKASNGFWHSFYFTTGGFHEPIQIKKRNLEITEQACQKCHDNITQAIATNYSGPHATRTGESVSCVRCHRSVGHLH